jgi:hypothetical protein
MSTPVKMSQFSTVHTFTSGSFAMALESGSSGITNTKISSVDLAAYITGSQWKSVPANSNAAGALGNFSADTTYFYVHNGVKWYRLSLGSLF